MSGPGVSLSGSGVCGPFDPSVSVMLVSPTYQPNSQYCIDGEHAAVAGGTATTRECITTAGGPPRVTGLDYEQIQTDDLSIDANPNVGGGLRIFPDKKIPAETVDRRRIRVKAQHSQTTAGARIYFRNFDVDDPSADVAPIDTNDTATVKLGNDNNGNVDGTTATRAGQFVVPPAGQPNPYNCQTFSNASASGVSCETDASGTAKVDFIVTQQPGDNFEVVADPDETYVSSLIPDADVINLKDATNIQTPVTTTASNGCANSTVTACRADMLTVWRRLHIEVDSMGPANANYERGEVDKKTKIGPGKTKTLKVNINANNPF